MLNVALVTTCSSFLCSLAASTSSLHIGALLPVAENPRFFNKDLEFICEIAVDHVNESPDILPNHTLALELQDSMVRRTQSTSSCSCFSCFEFQ